MPASDSADESIPHGTGGPVPLDYLDAWYSDNGNNIAHKEIGWARLNAAHHHNPAYDPLYEVASQETDVVTVAELFVAMNNHVIHDGAVIPLVQRSAEKLGIADTLRGEYVAASSWEAISWNIANWSRFAPAEE